MLLRLNRARSPIQIYYQNRVLQALSSRQVSAAAVEPVVSVVETVLAVDCLPDRQALQSAAVSAQSVP